MDDTHDPTHAHPTNRPVERPPIAVVTGANTGIGKQIARQLLEAGLTVHVGSRDRRRGQAAVDELGSRAHLLVLDVTDERSVKQAAEQIPDLDVLINNAGVSDPGQPPSHVDVATLRHVYETNVFGVLAVTNAFLPALLRSARPRIVNISSGTGSLSWSTHPNTHFDHDTHGAFAAYRSSKAALNALTIFYAQELATHTTLKINAVAPGLRATDLNSLAAEHGGDPAVAAAEATRLALLDDDGPTGSFFSWDNSTADW